MTANISEQLELSWKDAWEHETRAPDGRWVKGASAKPKQWEFIGPHGSKAGAAFLPGNAEPEVGDMARDGHGGVGRVISKGGGHVVLDADDGNRYLVDWRNGGNVVRQLPLGDAKWIDPRAPLPVTKPAAPARPAFRQPGGDVLHIARDPHPPNPAFPYLVSQDGDEWHVGSNLADQLRHAELPPSPPGVYVAPGQKQLYLPGTEKLPSEFGSQSPAVRQLRAKWDKALQAIDNGNVKWPSQGAQGETAIVTLPGKHKVIVKRNLANELADREELAGYVGQAIGMERPPLVARTGPGDLIENYVAGKTAERFLNDHFADGDLEYELANTPEGQNIGLLDTLVSNSDRHDQNWMVTRDNNPIAIDMSYSWFDGENYYSPFRGNEEFEDPDRLAKIRSNLEKIEPEFNRMGHHDWWENMMARMTQLQENAEGNADTDEEDFSNISSQVELSWKDSWLHEKRDAHGRWTRGAAPVSYAMPDPARLHNERSRDYPDPGDHPFFQAHPVSAEHVMQRFDEASDAERAQGMNWYNDARDLAEFLGKGDVTKAAGVIAAYSPQTSWSVNMLNAARALDLGRAIGPGEGMITGTMQANAQRAFDGAPLDKVLKSPKTNAFGHLIAAGGDEPDDPYGKVVIDRHALSVAVGHRLSKKDVESSPIGKERFYEHVADAYREAALRLSEREGTVISPHQLQAITWLRQQDLNENEDQAAGAADPNLNRLQRGRESSRRNAWARWSAYDWEHGVPSQIGTTSLPGNAIAPGVQHSPAGFSVSMGSGKAPKTGFMVAQDDHTHTFPASVMDSERELADAIDQMLLAESATFSHEDVYLGGWVHDGKLWLEPSDNVLDQAAAQALAAGRNQIAIWDVAHGNEIQTGGSGGGTIYEHADAQGDHGRTGGLREPARGRAQGSGAADSPRDQVGIAAQLELASGWHDAWRHELRGKHGEWVRSGAGVPRETGWNSSTSLSLISEYQHASDPVIQGLVAEAGKAYDGHDPRGAATLLNKAAGKARGKGYFSDAARYSRLAEDVSGDADAARESAGAAGAVSDFTRKVADKVPGLYGGGTEAWNGKTKIFEDNDKPGVAAELDWDGHMNVARSVAASLREALSGDGPVNDPNAFAVILHELTHGLIGGEAEQVQKRRDQLGIRGTYVPHYYTGMAEYQDPRNAAIEEGSTELGVIYHAPEFFDAAGIGNRPTHMIAVDDAGNISTEADISALYDSQGELRKIRDILGEEGGYPGSMDAYRAMDNAIYAFRKPEVDLPGIVEALASAQSYTRSKEAAARIASLLSAMRVSDKVRHTTMSEYARRLQDPARIENGDAWGHYGWQTAAAQQWVQEIARDEGHETTAPGTPGWERARALSDEINRVGTDQKPRVMARQVVRAAGLDPDDEDAIGSNDWHELEDRIRSQWKRGSASPGRIAHGKAAKFLSQRAERMRAQEKGAA